MKSMQAVCSKLRRGLDRALQGVACDITTSRSTRRRVLPWALSCLALGFAPSPAQSANVLSQSGISYTGAVDVTAIGDVIGMTGSTAFPDGGFTLGDFAFRGAITVGTDLWLLPNDANQIVKVDTLTGEMTGYPLISDGSTLNKFVGGAYDGTHIWLAPYNANSVVRFTPADQDSQLFNNWPAGITPPNESAAFAGAVFDGTYVWLAPLNAEQIVRLDPAEPNSTQMVGFDLPVGYRPTVDVADAYWGGLFDGTNLWLVPFNADAVIKVPVGTGIPEIVSAWPAGFVMQAGAFAGGTFDGTSVWLAPYDADRAISIDVSTDVMTGYGSEDDATQWPATFTKGVHASFNGAVYDGADVWLVPFEADHLVKIDATSGAMTGYTNFPAEVDASDLDKFAGGVVADDTIYLVPGTRSGQSLVKIFATETPAVASIERHHPGATVTNADTVLFNVTFNKPVLAVDSADFTVTATGDAVGTITAFAPNSTATTTFVVTVESVAGDGTLRLDLNASGTGIVDEYTNPVATGFTAGETFTIDNIAPVVTSATAAAGTYDTAFNFVVTASGDPIIFGQTAGQLPPGLVLNAGTGSITGTPTGVGTFDVTVSAADSAGNIGADALQIVIAPKALTVAGVTAIDRDFDGTAVAPLSVAGATLIGFAVGDDVELDASGTPATFDDADVGVNKPVTVTGLALAGADAGNYTLTQPSGLTASITPASVDIALGGLAQTYDGSAKSVTATTTPADVPLTVTYDGSGVAPTSVGSYAVVATVADPNYSGTENAVLVIAKAAVTVAITDTASVFDGSPKPVAVATTPVGLTVDVTYDGSATVPTAAGSYAVVATVADPNYSGVENATLVIAKAAATVVITDTTFVFDGSPKPVTVTTTPAGLTVDVTYNGSPAVPSATGAYAVVATVNEANYTGTAAANLLIGSTSRLVNISARADVGTGDDILIPGFVISGTGTKRVLVRGIGPGLEPHGVPESEYLETPTLRLLDAGGGTLATNTGWGTSDDVEEILEASAAVGAFDLLEDSADSVILATLPVGSYTLHLSGVDNTTGIGLVEVYDADEAASTAHLVNVSARAVVGVGNDVLIPGFVIEGDVPRTILVRAVGPTLADQIAGVLEDPIITVLQGQVALETNDNWGEADNASEVAATAVAIGAFPLDEGGKDAALLIELQPGHYTINVSGVGETTGVALVELFQVD